MKKLIAESIGTFCFVFAGTRAIVINDATRASVVGIAMTFGLIVMAMIYTLGDISGAHLNPAVTFGFLAALRFQGRLVLPYILSQLSGAILASLTLRCLFHEHATLWALRAGRGGRAIFFLEVILTSIVMFVILSVCGSNSRAAY